MDVSGGSAPAREAKKRSINLELFGQRLTLVSDNEEGHVRELVDFLNRRLEEAKASSRRVQTDQIALLAALNIAEELFRERAQHQSLKRRVRERSRKLLSAIDQLAEQLEPADPAGAKGGQHSPLPGA